MFRQTLEAQMKRAVAALLTDSCDITARVTTKNEYGAPQDATSSVVKGVACRVISLPRNQRSEAGTQGGAVVIPDTYRLIVPAGTALASGQRVTLASDGQTYEVVDVNTALTNAPFAEAVITRAA